MVGASSASVEGPASGSLAESPAALGIFLIRQFPFRISFIEDLPGRTPVACATGSITIACGRISPVTGGEKPHDQKHQQDHTNKYEKAEEPHPAHAESVATHHDFPFLLHARANPGNCSHLTFYTPGGKSAASICFMILSGAV